MSENPLYEIVETEGRGKIMIATVDMLPGTKIFKEEAPLLFFPGSLKDTAILAYTAFQNLSLEQKNKVLNLYGPTSGVEADMSRLMARHFSFQHKDDHEPRKLTEYEIQTFVKLSSVTRLNMFWVDEVHAVYEIISRMSHSCLPNCTEQFYGRSVTCRTILPVVAGQELTIEYNSAHCWKPTHIRRQNYCTKKQFTCHCPRCEAEGDDTRLFDCFDPQCLGSHLVCQPLNQEIIPFGICSYTGVEYVEPHLLPCTVCHRAPPPQYQQDMFALEVHLHQSAIELQGVFPSLTKGIKTDPVAAQKAFKRIQALKMPKGHSLTVTLLKTRYDIAALMSLYNVPPTASSATTSSSAGKKSPPLMEICARDYVHAIERRSRFPSAQESENIIDTCFCTDFCAEYSRTFALECCQKALRTYLILHGRDAERKKYNDMMVKLLQQVPSQFTATATTTECTFCGESSLRAALTLSRCGRCRQVTYCSAGCQKAHWSLHKKECCKKR